MLILGKDKKIIGKTKKLERIEARPPRIPVSPEGGNQPPWDQSPPLNT